MAMVEFVDTVRVHVAAGDGGDGCTSFFRQPHEPKGRPDGGDGGHGGDVVLRASHDVTSLLDLHHRPHRRARRGRHGQGDRRRGADGATETIAVPEGTVVLSDDGQTVLADLAIDGDELVGRGNGALATVGRRTPRYHELGEPGEQRWLRCELKLLADVALVGMPNAGKSSLIAHLSAAKPKIAAYPFTTLTPKLGVVRADPIDVTVADVPGLIPGSSAGRGLGDRFLRHIERCQAVVYVLDCASFEGRDPRKDLAALVEEVAAYAPDTPGLPGQVPLDQRPALVWLNKVDADREVAELMRDELAAQGWEVLVGSGVTGEGLDGLTRRMSQLVAGERAAAPARERAARTVLRPLAEPEPLSVAATSDGWEVTGGKVDRWVARTDFGNDEAVRALQRTLVRAGVEDALVAAGAVRGDTVILGEVAFDFDPEMPDAQEAGDADAQEAGDTDAQSDTAFRPPPPGGGQGGVGEPAR
ncbi:MAG: GTPase ObgE [Actinobacteria bacterium QS_8_72_14]|nr:MAG: GTPase ObgE [Actinobacteria bacterium QS_8_72_14]